MQSLYQDLFSLEDIDSDRLQRESTATIVGTPNTYKQGSPAKPQEIIRIDCRGLEFTEFIADGEWSAVGANSSTKFSGIELDQGDWYDYDEKVGEEVSIKDLKWAIRKA
ncbi:MAG: hypothetical protein GOMPHAMPRED_000222 [Gomphillus americanus]|uniref:Uncharacterized protein n=1 Tax=Gomphillus americanus TaxID=1940652 RepID=A0A8H3I1A8_9LECA|nr:MAG: hypothetical protein GOMPHAMPRED_000222 [Gomphillus americanus]